LAAIGLLAGCSTVPWNRIDLSRRQVHSLATQSRDPAGLGLEVFTNNRESLQLRGFYEFDPRFAAQGSFLETSPGADPLPILEITVNGHRVPALIDTGSSMSMAGMTTVHSGGIIPLGQPMFTFRTTTFSGTRRVVLGLAGSVEFGGGMTRRVPFTILNRIPGMQYDPFDPIGETDVLLGEDLLRRYGAVTLSHLAGSYSFMADPIDQGEDDRTVYASAPMRRREMGVSVFTARINGQPDVQVGFDSGGSFGLWVPEQLAEDLSLPELHSRQRGRGVLHATLPPMFRPVAPGTLQVGELTIDDLSCYVGSIEGGKGNPGFVLLGNEVLKRYDIRLNDFGTRVEFLKPLTLP
jgi:hypothetical protein